MATLIKCIIAYNGISGPTWWQAGDSSIKPCYVVARDDADEVKVIFKQILNKADGTTFIEEEHIFNGRNVYINAKNGLSMRISEIIE